MKKWRDCVVVLAPFRRGRFRAQRWAPALASGLLGPVLAYGEVSGEVIKVGVVSDLSSLYADVTGKGVIEAVQMAVQERGAKLLGKPVLVLQSDYQNKADVAANKAREWIDREGVDVLVAATNSSAALAMAHVAAEKRRPLLVVSTGTARLTNEDCNPYTIHYAYDTTALSKTAGTAIVKQPGGKRWYFLTADYAFGHSMESSTAEVVKANGGTVLGSVRHPIAASDMSSFLLQAKASGADVLGLADAGGDMINAIKTAREFGLMQQMKVAGLLMLINDVHALGLEKTQGMYLADSWYWDQNDAARDWAKKFNARMRKMPNSIHASAYSAMRHYLSGVEASGSDQADAVLGWMKANAIRDMLTDNGHIRPDGRMVSNIYLRQVKSPSQSHYAWDYYETVATVPGEQAFTTKSESKCAAWK